MGGVTRIAITGASGFVGRACVDTALARGLQVTAVLRRAPKAREFPQGVKVIQADLGQGNAVAALHTAFGDVDAVIHAAAHLGGDPALHLSDTVTATRHVLEAMEGTQTHLVLVSSIAVYDTDAIAPGSVVSEDSPLITADAPRDAYSGAKLAQEALVRQAGRPAWLLRPGAIYGPGRSWHALMGFWVGPLHVLLASDGALPMTHVSHCARTFVDAAMQKPEQMHIANVVDDDLPTRWRYLSAHKSLYGWPKAALPVPWRVWFWLTRAVSPLGDRLPGLLQTSVLRARIMPLRFSNRALRQALGGQDDAPFEAMLARDHAEGAA